MKKIISWFLGCLLLATMTTCNNEKYLPIYTIEGKLYWDCERMMPVHNATIQLGQLGSFRSSNSSIKLGEATTDAEGYFKLDYKVKEDDTWSSFQLTASGTNLYKTLKTSKEKMQYKGDLFVKNTVNLNVSLKKGQKFYTETDTLYYALMRLDRYENSYQFVMYPPKIVNNLKDLESINVSIENLDISNFCENEGKFVYAIGWENYIEQHQAFGRKSPSITFTDCNKNQQITIDLP